MAGKPTRDEAHDDGSGGMSRREMIRNAAIAGGLAWTAPIIVESVMNPAYAFGSNCTCGSGTTLKRTSFTVSSGHGPTPVQCIGTPTDPGTCAPTCWTVATNDCTTTCVTGSPPDNGNNAENFTLTAGAGHVFLGATRKNANGSCDTITPSGTTADFGSTGAAYTVFLVYCC